MRAHVDVTAEIAKYPDGPEVGAFFDFDGTIIASDSGLAMDAGVPIVPIVIHNAMDICPKGAFVYRAGTVDIDILPPVDTNTWRKAAIKQHMDEIRQLYLEVLGQV